MRRYGSDYFTGTHWLQSTVALIVLLLVALGVLRVLNEMQERGEKLAVELTARYMETGLKLAVAEALLHGSGAAVASWAGGNPVTYLAGPPQGYKGRCDAQDLVQPAPGVWCFDETRGELRYRPRNQQHLRLGNEAHPEGEAVLRWRVALGEKRAPDVANIGVSVQLVTPYAWID